MPFVSQAQARAMHAKAARGEIPESTVSEFDQVTNFSNLPERRGPPKAAAQDEHATRQHVQRKYVDGLKKFMRGKIAEGLKKQYGPKEAPAEPKSEAPPVDDLNLDDPSTLERLRKLT